MMREGRGLLCKERSVKERSVKMKWLRKGEGWLCKREKCENEGN